jgi:hypothetical protein
MKSTRDTAMAGKQQRIFPGFALNKTWVFKRVKYWDLHGFTVPSNQAGIYTNAMYT